MTKSPVVLWGAVLGFALGGFFDGILLHQILQWHHLLSLVSWAGDLRFQVLWDGYFHALMYGIAVLGLWGLWRAHRRSGVEWGRNLAGALLVGFGVWHVVDGVLSHWVLGIHRIKLDSDSPLVWDLIWLVGFGLVPLLVGLTLLRSHRSRLGSPRPSAVAVLALAALTAAAGTWALQPPPDQPFTTVVFRPGMEAAEVMAAVAGAGARLVWADSAMGVVVLDLDPERRWSLYRQGAMLVSGAGAPAGCVDWSSV